MDAPTRPASPPADARTVPTPDELLRSATAIHALLADVDEDDHRTRIRLVAAQDRVRTEAARQWRQHGWRPITDAVLHPRRLASVLLAPALSGIAAAIGAVWLFDASVLAVLVLAGVACVPWVAEVAGYDEGPLRVSGRVGATVLVVGMLVAPPGVAVLFLPSMLLLAAVGLVGTQPR